VRRGRVDASLRQDFSTDTIADAMVMAQVDPALIYAFRKTGFMPTADTLDLFSEADRQAWEAAIEEYEVQQLVRVAGGGA